MHDIRAIRDDPAAFDAALARRGVPAQSAALLAADDDRRALATRLWEITDDPGMKDMLGFMIARDTMHQQQWLAVIE